MSSYRLEVTLPSCVISKSTIQEIELYLRGQTAAHNKDHEKEGAYSFSIVDSLGSESFLSVDDYRFETFPNNAKALVLSYRNWKGAVENLTLRLSSSRDRSNLELSVKGQGAKEIAIGITSEVKRRLSEQRTYSFIFHGKLDFLRYVMLGLSFGAVGTSAQEKSLEGAITALFALTCAIGFFVSWSLLKWASPYCFIDTQRNRQIRKTTSWLLISGLGGIVFSGFSKLLWN